MRRYLYSVAFAAVLVTPALVTSGGTAAAGQTSPHATGLTVAAAARAHIGALDSKPWGKWSVRAAQPALRGVTAASASSGLRDPLGDEINENGQPVNQPRADLVSASARNTGTTITLTAATAVLSNPYSDPAWGESNLDTPEGGGETGPSWDLSPRGEPSSLEGETPGQLAFVSLTSFDGTLQGQVQLVQSVPGQSGEETFSSCNATASFVASGPNAGYSVSFPSSCLGEIGRFYWDVTMSYDPASDPDGPQAAGDQAPNSGLLPEVDVYPATQGYWLAATDGGVFTHGSAAFDGSQGGQVLNAPIAAAAATPDGRGYFLAAADGGVFTHGNALFHGSIGSRRLTSPIVAISVTPDGGGYLLVGANGSVYSFGDAPALGSVAGFALTAPVVAAAITPDDNGYWLFSADGGVFNFGDAGFFGSPDAGPLNSPIVGASTDPGTGGYWLVAADGGVFSFDAPFYGSEGGEHLNAPMVGITSAQNGAGYRLVAADGGLFDFGATTFAGSEGGQHLNAPVVAVASVEP